MPTAGSRERRRFIDIGRSPGFLLISSRSSEPNRPRIRYSVQRDHIHLIAEADGSVALSKGLQGLTIRIAKGLNALLGEHGQVFKERYHLHVLGNPHEVMRALRYVLNNAAHHAAQRGHAAGPGDVDPFSSAGYFDGWAPGWWARRVKSARGEGPPPVAAARSWLVRIGWRKHGLLVPGHATSTPSHPR